MIIKRNTLFPGIWLIGIGILALTGWWWPGIMFVIAAASLAGGSLQGGIWLAGIGILAATEFWWPGIMFVLGVSVIAGAVFPERREDRLEEDNVIVLDPPVDQREAAPVYEEAFEAPAPVRAAPRPGTDLGWMPGTCPACGGPLNEETLGDTVGHPDGASCPFCETFIEKSR